jgi:hypothetical protein
MNEQDKIKINKYLQHWNLLEEQIKVENSKIGELYKRRQEIENKIKRYNNLFSEKKLVMIDQNNIKYDIYTINKKKQISLKLLKHIINNYFENTNFNKEDLYKYILKNRETIEKIVITRN